MINIYPSCWYEDHIRSTRSVDELDLLISRFLVFDVSRTPCQSCRWWESWKTYHTYYIYLPATIYEEFRSIRACMIYVQTWLINGKSDIGEVQSDDRFYRSCKISIWLSRANISSACLASLFLLNRAKVCSWHAHQRHRILSMSPALFSLKSLTNSVQN